MAFCDLDFRTFYGLRKAKKQIKHAQKCKKIRKLILKKHAA